MTTAPGCEAGPERGKTPIGLAIAATFGIDQGEFLMQKKAKSGEKGSVVGKIQVNLDEGTASLSGMMQSYKVRLKGVSYTNVDGTNRQDIIARCKIGEELELAREPENPKDKAAVAVYYKDQQIGYLPAGDRRLSVHMDAGFEVFAHIVAIDGGPTFVDRLCWWRRPTSYGCVVQIDKGYKKPDGAGKRSKAPDAPDRRTDSEDRIDHGTRAQ